MIENESQQGGVALDHDETTAGADEHGAGVTDRRGDVEIPPDAPRTEGGLTTAGVVATLRELGPVVGGLTLLSVTLPGVLGTTVLVGTAVAIAPLTTLLGVFRAIDPAGTATAMLAATALFAVFMAATTGSMLLPTYALSFVAGAFFGFAGGGTAAMFGVTVGACIGYLWGMLMARGRVMDVIQRHEKASIVRGAIVDRSLLQETLMVGLIRIPPNSPFALTNLLMSATSVRLVPYVLGTFLGIAPRTLFAVWIGAEVQDLAEAQSAGGSMRVIIGIAIGITVFLVVYRLLSSWARDALRDEADA